MLYVCLPRGCFLVMWNDIWNWKCCCQGYLPFFFFRRFQGRSWHLHLLVLHTPAIPLHVSVLGAVISWVLFPINVGLFIPSPTGYSTMKILRINMSLWCKHITCIQDILSLPKLHTCFPCTLLRLVVVLTISGLICRNTYLQNKKPLSILQWNWFIMLCVCSMHT